MFFVATLATLLLRALTPAGYMPGSADSGLLYELCPEGMPVEIMQSLSGGGQHHHHSGGESESAADSEQCPIGHMLASAVAVDTGGLPEVVPDVPLFEARPVALVLRGSATAYRSRAPPA